MLLDDVCIVLHVTPLYPTFSFFLRLSLVLIVLINYITRYVASLMSVCFSGSLPAYSCIQPFNIFTCFMLCRRIKYDDDDDAALHAVQGPDFRKIL